MQDRPKALQVAPGQIPPALRDLPRWVLWSYVHNGKKWTKVPFRSNGYKASSTNARTWTSFQSAYDSYLIDSTFDGIGFIFNGDGVVGIDLDHCVSETGLSAIATETLATVEGYWEQSPSGTGLHCITLADIERSHNTPGVEVYKDGRFFTITGHEAHGTLPASPVDLAPFITKHFGTQNTERVEDTNDPLMVKQPIGRTLDELSATLDLLDPDMPEPDWVKVIWALCHETSGSPEGYQLAVDWSSQGLKFDDLALEERWNRARDTNPNAYTWRSVEHSIMPPKPKVLHASKEDPFPQYDAKDYQVGYQSAPWIIKNLIPQAQFGIIYGDSGSGKTFAALDLAATIANGQPYRGHKSRADSVLYVAAEAGEGIKKRLAGYTKEYGVINNLRIMPNAPDLLNVLDAPGMIISTMLHAKTSLIIIDTLAASHNGDENSSQDMGRVIAQCKHISNATGAMVLLVHHTGKTEGKGMRGSSALFAAADVVIEITAENDIRQMRTLKQKDGELLPPFGFALHQVFLANDQDGDPITTCVVKPAEIPVSSATIKLNDAVEYIVSVFDNAMGDVGDPSMTIDELVEAVHVSQIIDKREVTPKSNIKRSVARATGVFSFNPLTGKVLRV